MRWLLAAMTMFAMTTPIHAQGWIDPVRPIPDFGVHKLRSVVTVHVSGRVANVEVEEWFRNDGGGLGEGDYLYPLPGEAVFSNFSLFQGDRELRGETMDAARARAIYEEIVRSKRDPALIELAGHGLLRARVFPIAAGETRKITLRYTQMLARMGDALQFQYAAGTRTQTRGTRDNVPISFTLVIDDARTFGNPFSPTHGITVERNGRSTAVRPEAQLVGDFDVFLPLRSSAVALSLVTHRPSSEPGFFMLTLSPSSVNAERSVPRDVTIVLDVSGSMSGEKIVQARSALNTLLASLSAQDRFRLIAFSDQVRTYRNEWLPATETALSTARSWVNSLRAEGGTNISGALTEAFAAPSAASRLPFVIFITDGLPSVGEQNPERIAARAEAARGRARVFAFGVGYDVNTYLLDRLTAAARGGTQYVRPGESVERSLSVLAAKIRFPVLTDLRLGDMPVRIDEVYPVDLPDLFAQEELVIVGRYRGAGRGSIAVAGRRGGRNETFSANASFAEHELGNDYIPKVWASRKVGYLTQRLKLRGNDPETLDQLRETALRYGILSEYTSYLVQEPVERQLVAGSARGASSPAPMQPPPPPTASVGEAAVQSAVMVRKQREARTAMEADAVSAEAAGNSARRDVQLIAGRTFRNVNGTWTDTNQTSPAQVLLVKPFSNAYFALLRALPELEPYWKAFTNVQVSGRNLSVKLAPQGASQLSAKQIADAVKEFRKQ